MRYSREYRKREKRLPCTREIVFNYMLDVYLPILSILEGRRTNGDKRKLYLNITHRYLYYLRYSGEKKLIDFERKYLSEGSFQNFIGSALNLKINRGDMFRDIKKLLIYYAVTKAEGEKQVEDFYRVVNTYHGTDNFRTVHNLRESLISAMEKDHKINWVVDILQKDLEALAGREEVIVNYNTKRVLKYVKGIWKNYSLIDYYATLIPLDFKWEEGNIEKTALEYMKRDFRY